MSKMSWKAAYWPRIIEEEAKRFVPKNQNRQTIYVYDYGGALGRYYGKHGFTGAVKGNYLYLNNIKIMQHTIDNWDEICELSMYFSNLRSSMRTLENRHLLKVIYMDRLEGFNALVAENDN